MYIVGGDVLYTHVMCMVRNHDSKLRVNTYKLKANDIIVMHNLNYCLSGDILRILGKCKMSCRTCMHAAWTIIYYNIDTVMYLYIDNV